jgi:hypothetical protein
MPETTSFRLELSANAPCTSTTVGSVPLVGLLMIAHLVVRRTDGTVLRGMGARLAAAASVGRLKPAWDIPPGRCYLRPSHCRGAA